MNTRRFSHKKEQGITLIVTMIMLVIMMLLSVAAINMSTTNLKVVGNMQLQQEVASAAQSAINQVLSKGTYLSDPSSAPTTLTVGHYTVSIVKPCLKASVTLLDADLTSPPTVEDQKCKTSSVWRPGRPTEMTDCARVTFQVTAVVNDASTKAQATVVQGASIRMDRILADAYKNNAAMLCN